MIINGFLWIFKKVHEAAQEEMDRQGERITTDLRELYQMLEAEKISEAEFDVREKNLLDRLEEAEGKVVFVKREAA